MDEHPTADDLERFRRAWRGRDANADAAGLAEAIAPASSHVMRPLLIAASVIVVIGSIVFFSLRRPAPPVPRPTPPVVTSTSIADYGRDDWNALVRNALETGDAQWPDSELKALRGPVEAIRGAAPAVVLEPVGAIVERRSRV